MTSLPCGTSSITPTRLFRSPVRDYFYLENLSIHPTFPITLTVENSDS
jgi:hypothetical protein